MAGKILLNVLCNLAILISGFGFIWGVKNQHFIISTLAVAGVILLVNFKLRLIKQVKELTKKNN